MRAVFDRSTGLLLEIVSRKTGWRIQNRLSHAQAFSLVAPLPCRLLNQIDGTAESIHVKEHPSENRLKITWAGLLSPYCDKLDISLVVEVALSDGGLSFAMKVMNRSEHVVESVCYPYIGDLGMPPHGRNFWRMSPNYCAMHSQSLYPDFPNELGYCGTDCPMQAVPTPKYPFLLIQSERDRLYVGCHDMTANERTEFAFQLRPGYSKVGTVPPGGKIGEQDACLEFTVTHLPFAQSGETVEMAPNVLRPYRAGWHAGADIYRQWRDTWMVKPRRPGWIEDIHSWQQIQMTSWGDSLRIRYSELVEYANERVKHGVKAIQLVGWTVYGQDGRLPDRETDPRLSTRDELGKAIEEIEDMGVRVILYEKYTCADISTDWYRRELYRYSSKDIFGNTHRHGGWRYHTPAHLAGINTRPYAWMCMNSTEWQDVALHEIEKSLDLNPSGILLDESQNHGEVGFCCYDKGHGHRVPAYNYAGDGVFERRVLDLLCCTYSPLVFAGEGGYDLQYRHYNLLYHRTGPGHIPATRYIDPSLPLMDWVYGYDDREGINRCLLYRYIISYESMNLKGHLEDFPLTLEYGTKVDSLRRLYREFLWDGEFRDMLGAQVTVDQLEEGHRRSATGRSPVANVGLDQYAGPIVYSVFRSRVSAKRVAVVVNHGEATEPVRARLDGSEANDRSATGAGRSAPSGAFVVVSPERPDAQPCDGSFRVRPRSAAVVMEL